jgi:hypothetical protein
MNITRDSKSMLVKVSFLFVTLIMIMACSTGGLGVQPTETPEPPKPTNTPEPTSTITLTPTKTARPTRTPKPTATLTSTPAPLGIPVKTDKYEVTVVGAVDLKRIYPGGKYLYTPNAKYMIVDIGVRVRNLNPGQTITLPWSDIYVIESNNESWYALWGDIEEVTSGTEMDPFTIGISDEEIDGNTTFSFQQDAYFRVIYILDRENPKNILFGFGDSPMITLTIVR